MAKTWWQGVIRSRWGGRSFWLGELPVVLALALAIPMQLYFRQQDAYNYLSELWLLVGLFGGLAVVLTALYHRLLAQPASRLLAALAAFFALTVDFDARLSEGDGFLGVIVPHHEIIFVALIILTAAYTLGRLVEWADRRWPRWHNHTLAVMLRLLIMGIFATNSYFLVSYLAQENRSLNYVPPATSIPQNLQPTAARDVYYIVLDRYASSANLAANYQFDNHDFTDFLQNQGFVVRDNAYSNYQFTAPSIASTMSMDYLNDIQSKLGGTATHSYMPYRKILEQSPVSQLFAQAGYVVTRLASWYGVTRNDQEGTDIDPQFAMTLFGHTFLLTDLQSAILDHTVFASWFRSGLSIGGFTLAQLAAHSTGQLVLDQITDLEDLAATPHAKPNFVFAHILSPHPQYVFLPDGSSPTYSTDDNDFGAPRQLKYTNQLQFLNSQVKTMIEKIKASSKVPPVIIIQADEGPYPAEFADKEGSEEGAYPWEKVSTDTLKQKYGILAAYYLPDVPAEDKAQLNSSVNAFRFVFNHYFTGADYAYLPDCSLLFNGNNPYSFYDVTAKLRGSADDACPKYADRGTLK